MQNKQTPGQLSKSLDITTATLRNYVKHFGQFLSPDAQRKSRKRFNPDDVQTLRYAKSLLDDGLTYAETLDQLESQPLEGEVLDDLPPIDLPPATEIPSSAIQTKEFYDQFFKPALDAKDETISELKEDKDRLQRQLNYERLPWFRRVFRDPPE